MEKMGLLDMNRVLTFSTNISAGHRRAAEAVARAIIESAPGAEIFERDAMMLMGRSRRRVLTDAYLSIIRYKPELWDHLYRNKRIIGGMRKIWRIFLARAREAFEAEIERHRPDMIICTQAIPARVIATLKAEGGCRIPLLAVATDYGIHPYWADPFIDGYAVPCEEAAEELAADGIDRSRIHVTGIPVDRVFENPPARAAARRELGLDPRARYVLAMGGGNGLGLEASHIETIERTPGVDGVIVIAGSNRRLEEALRELPPAPLCARHVHAMVSGIERYYAAADVLVSKPGGLTMAEATAMRMPVIMISPLPGQERRNAEFLLRSGAAVMAETADDLTRELTQLFRDPSIMAERSHAAASVGRPHASRRIAALALELADRSLATSQTAF